MLCDSTCASGGVLELHAVRCAVLMQYPDVRRDDCVCCVSVCVCVCRIASLVIAAQVNAAEWADDGGRIKSERRINTCML